MITIECEPPREFLCDCCGGTTVSLTRFVSQDGDAFAVYYARFGWKHPEQVSTVDSCQQRWTFRDSIGRRIMCVLAVVTLLQAGSAGCRPSPSALPSAQVVASRVDSFLAPYVEKRDFSGTILLARDGRILVSRGFGFADFEKRIATGDGTVYGIGSISKTMTAAAIEHLAAQGRLALSDPVTKFLPGFAHGDSITITNLLEHSSGLKDYYSWPAYAAGRAEPITPAGFLSELQTHALDFPPGTQSSYSNSGYFVLAAIIERVSGLSYGEYLSRNLFRPLQMEASGNFQDGVPVRDLAKGYDPGFPPALVQPAASVSRSWLQGSGSIYASAGDLDRWLEATWRDTLIKLLPYPYGWGKRTRFGRDALEQNGRIPIGYASYAALYPSDDLVVVVLSNIQAEVTEVLGVGLAAIALGQEYEPPPVRPAFEGSPSGDSARFAAYAGRYAITPDFVLTVRTVGQGILLAGPDGAFLPVDWEGQDHFFFRPLYVPISFDRDKGGRITSLNWNGQFKAARLDPGAGQ